MNASIPPQVPESGDPRCEIERRFPHIVARLVASWHDQDVIEGYLSGLMLEDRPHRAGFPPEAFAEIMFLSDLVWRRRHFNTNGIQVSPDNFSFTGI